MTLDARLTLDHPAVHAALTVPPFRGRWWTWRRLSIHGDLHLIDSGGRYPFQMTLCGLLLPGPCGNPPPQAEPDPQPEPDHEPFRAEADPNQLSMYLEAPVVLPLPPPPAPLPGGSPITCGTCLASLLLPDEERRPRPGQTWMDLGREQMRRQN